MHDHHRVNLNGVDEASQSPCVLAGDADEACLALLLDTSEELHTWYRRKAVVFFVSNQRSAVIGSLLYGHRIVRPPLALICFVKLNEIHVVSLKPT